MDVLTISIIAANIVVVAGAIIAFIYKFSKIENKTKEEENDIEELKVEHEKDIVILKSKMDFLDKNYNDINLKVQILIEKVGQVHEQNRELLLKYDTRLEKLEDIITELKESSIRHDEILRKK